MGLGIRTGLTSIFGAALLFASTAAADVKLLMVEEVGCYWCARWKAEIGPIYPKTPEGRIAPLDMVMLGAPLPEGVSLTSRPVYTPTFILLNDGQEVSRIEGYPGEDFFWGLLGRMIESLPEELQKDPGV